MGRRFFLCVLLLLESPYMEKNTVLVAAAVALLGFAFGFFLANTFNRGEMDVLRAENERLRSNSDSSPQQTGQTELAENEIQAKISEADASPENLGFQRNLGLALYRYSSMKQDVRLLGESARLIERAISLSPKDRELKVAAGNAHFDMGYFGKQNESFEKARKYYSAALADNPTDSNVITDLGLSYFLQDPQDLAAAKREFDRSLKIDPKNEKTLQFAIQTLWRMGRGDEAADLLEQLKVINPKSPAVNELSSILTQNPPKQ